MNNELGEVSRCYSLKWTRQSKHSAARLWRALTDAEEVTAWMRYPARVDLRVGGEYFADFARIGGGLMDGVIVSLEPERLLRYAWNLTVVQWAIEPDGAGCRYTFSQTGLPARDEPGEEGLPAGWHGWFEDLDAYLDTGIAPADDGVERWQELGRQYRPLLAKALGELFHP